MSVGNAYAQLAVQCIPQGDFAADCSRFIDSFCELAAAHKVRNLDANYTSRISLMHRPVSSTALSTASLSASITRARNVRWIAPRLPSLP
jgi:hypothetical protein